VNNLPATKIEHSAQPALIPQGGIYSDMKRFEFAQRIAKSLSDAKMVPDVYRGSIGDCLIAIDLAERLGASPFMVMQNTYMIKGKPGLEAKLVIALVNNCGRFSPIEYEEDGDLTKPKNDEHGCIAYATDLKSGKVLKGIKVTWGMVKSEGWDRKDRSKWKTGMAPQMFRYRSAAFFARTHCPDVLLGMETKDEIVDYVDAEPITDGTYAVPERDYRNELDQLIADAGINAAKAEAWLNHQVKVTGRDYDDARAFVVDNWDQSVIDHIKGFDQGKAATPKRDESEKKTAKPPGPPPANENQSPKATDIGQPEVIETLVSTLKGMYPWITTPEINAIHGYGHSVVRDMDEFETWPDMAASLLRDGDLKVFLGEYNEQLQSTLQPGKVDELHWKVFRFFPGGYGSMKQPGVEGFFERMKAHIDLAPETVKKELIYKWDVTHKDGQPCPIQLEGESGAEGGSEPQEEAQAETDTEAEGSPGSDDGGDNELTAFQKWVDSLPRPEAFAIQKEAGLFSLRIGSVEDAGKFRTAWEKLYGDDFKKM
jgi:hypothetical protein